MKFSRLRNYGLWVSIAAFLPMFLKSIGKDILPANYSEIVQAFLGILVLAGIISNPTTENRGFLDDKVNGEEREKE